MSEIKTETNIVEALRSKTEQIDIKQYLKSTLGGYTKKSVLEYLNLLRKQQQVTADTFHQNQQSLFNEKENLKKENDILKNRISKAESEYRNLFEALRSNKLNGQEISESDIIALKNSNSALEEELNKSDIEKSKLENQIELQNKTIEDYKKISEQADKEKLAFNEMLKSEMLESKKQRRMVSQLSGTIEEKNKKINFLNSLLSEDRLVKLTEKVKDLTQQLASQTEIMTDCNHENSLKAQTIEVLTQENNTLKQNIMNLSKSLEESNLHNDKLLFTYRSLSDQLEEEYKKSILLIKEKSEISMEKLFAARKLEEATAKISMLDMRLQEYISNDEMSELNKNADKTEEIKSDVCDTVINSETASA